MFFVLSSSGVYKSNITFSNSITKLSTLKRFKVFKKTTKFKKYALGVSRTIINRKKYVTRKRRSSFLIFQKYAYFPEKKVLPSVFQVEPKSSLLYKILVIV